MEAESAGDKGNEDEADRLIDQAIASQPKEVSAYLKRAELYLKEGDSSEAIEYIGAEILPKFDDLYEDKDFLSLMGDIYLERNELSDAAFYYEKWLELFPEDEVAQMKLEECKKLMEEAK